MLPNKVVGAALAAVVLLSACGMFESQATRREKAYERYIGQSMKANIQRQKAAQKMEERARKAAAKQGQQEVRPGPEAMTTPGVPEMPPPNTPDTAAPAPVPDGGALPAPTP